MAGTGTLPPLRLLAVALTTTSKRPGHRVEPRCRQRDAMLARPGRHGGRSVQGRALAACGWPRRCRRGRASISGPSTPAAAPPAPISSRSRPGERHAGVALRCRSPGRRRRCCRRRSRRRRSARCCRPAPAGRARDRRVASAAASNLNGTVTLQPLPPSARKARTACAKVAGQHQPLFVAQVLAGELRRSGHGSRATCCAPPDCP